MKMKMKMNEKVSNFCFWFFVGREEKVKEDERRRVCGVKVDVVCGKLMEE